MIAAEHEAFYRELISRNSGLIRTEEQRALRETRFIIAGCGSTGGACVMPLARSGAEQFVLLDPGAYEVSNLNRQEATLAEVGKNKALATRSRLLAVNPFAAVEVHVEGVVAEGIGGLLRPADLVVDAVDVTTQDGVDAKLALHQAACQRRLRVITAYDIATTQYLEVFDYAGKRRALDGRVNRGDSPDRLLRALIPPLAVPREIFEELVRRQRDPERPFPQLAMTSLLLGSLIVPYVLRLLTGRPVRRRMRIDLYDLIRPEPQRVGETVRRIAALAPLWWRLRG